MEITEQVESSRIDLKKAETVTLIRKLDEWTGELAHLGEPELAAELAAQAGDEELRLDAEDVLQQIR